MNRQASDKYIGLALEPAAAARGYTAERGSLHRRQFARRRADTVSVIYACSYFGHDKEWLAIRLGVYVPSIEQLLSGTPGVIEGCPEEFACTLRTEVGLLIDNGPHEHRWSLLDCENGSALAQDIAAVCEDHVFPWLERRSDLRGIADTLAAEPASLETVASLILVGRHEGGAAARAALEREAPLEAVAYRDTLKRLQTLARRA
jgi:hypothetical protein